jgi:hypothetical protein
MHHTLTALTLLGVGFAFGGNALAQDKSASSSTPVTVTGCLAKGATDNDFTIRDTSGKSYNLTSSSVALKGHIGHEVTITGTPASASSGGSTASTTSSSASGSGEHLTVSNLKMVSTTCK